MSRDSCPTSSEQKSYARQVKLSCLPYVYYICKQYVAARARNFQTFLGRLCSDEKELQTLKKCKTDKLMSSDIHA